MPAHKIPLQGRLDGSTQGVSGESELFYKNIKRLNQIENEYKGRIKAGEDAESFRKREPLVDQIGLGNQAEGVRANWSDNPKFPSVLSQEREDCLSTNPGQYDHIWEGGYATVLEGAYFAKDLNLARAQGRIDKLSADPLLRTKLFLDLG